MSKKVLVCGTNPNQSNIGAAVGEIFRANSGGLHEIYQVGETDCFRQDIQRYAPPGERFLSDADILVVSLGTMKIKNFADLDAGTIEEVISAVLTLPVRVLHSYVQARGSRGGSAVLVGSYAHENVLSGSVPYCAAKAGLSMAIKAAAWDLRDLPYRILGVHPYHCDDTPMGINVRNEIMESKGITREEAIAYQEKDLGDGVEPLSRHEVAEGIFRLATEDVFSTGTEITMYKGVR